MHWPTCACCAYEIQPLVVFLVGFTENYIQRPDSVCNGLVCESLDIKYVVNDINYAVNNVRTIIDGQTTLRITNGIRLCMPAADYNFNAGGQGGGGVQSGSVGYRNTDIQYSSCQSRFTT